MRRIQKGPEPAGLKAYRAVPGATFNGDASFAPVKDQIRAALLAEQLWVCCYCTRRISNRTIVHPTKPDAPPLFLMKIEHWKPQADFPELRLAWSNLFGACPGDVGRTFRSKDETCDTRKGEQEIKLNPLDPSHIDTLRCKSSGELRSTNPEFQKDIDDHLGLNHPVLVEERKRELDRAIRKLQRRHPNSTFPPGEVRRLMDELETPQQAMLRPFACTLRLWARQRYGKLE